MSDDIGWMVQGQIDTHRDESVDATIRANAMTVLMELYPTHPKTRAYLLSLERENSLYPGLR